MAEGNIQAKKATFSHTLNFSLSFTCYICDYKGVHVTALIGERMMWGLKKASEYEDEVLVAIGNAFLVMRHHHADVTLFTDEILKAYGVALINYANGECFDISQAILRQQLIVMEMGALKEASKHQLLNSCRDVARCGDAYSDSQDFDADDCRALLQSFEELVDELFHGPDAFFVIAQILFCVIYELNRQSASFNNNIGHDELACVEMIRMINDVDNRLKLIKRPADEPITLSNLLTPGQTLSARLGNNRARLFAVLLLNHLITSGVLHLSHQYEFIKAYRNCHTDKDVNDLSWAFLKNYFIKASDILKDALENFMQKIHRESEKMFDDIAMSFFQNIEDVIRG